MLDTNTVALRPLTEGDVPLLARWLSDPAVLEYYEGRDHPFSEGDIRQKFLGGDNEEHRTIIEYGGRPVGYLQYYPLEAGEQVEYGLAQRSGVYGVDLFLGEWSLWGRGIGKRAVSEAVRILREEGAALCVLDPREENRRAVRCYERCGFTVRRRLPAHELHEGKMRDCLLMALEL